MLCDVSSISSCNQSPSMLLLLYFVVLCQTIFNFLLLFIQINDIHKEGCTLKWNPPLDDGGAPLDHYLVEKMDTETGRWLPAAKVKDPKAEIANLVPGQEYKFRVSAVNNEGVSEPLDCEHAIIAKNPFGETSLFIQVFKPQ